VGVQTITDRGRHRPEQTIMHVLTDDRYATRRRLVVALATFLLVSTFVIRASDAAFEASYPNDASSLSTGTLELDGSVDGVAATTPLFGDTDSGALFRGVDLNAGETTNGCIDIDVVTSLDPDVLGEVTFEVSDYSDDTDNGLADDLTLAVDLLDGVCADDPATVSGGVYDGTLAAAAATGSGWNPNGDETRGFAISVTVDAGAEQGASVSGVDLTWRITTTNG
jgi:hypothetical protein